MHSLAGALPHQDSGAALLTNSPLNSSPSWSRHIFLHVHPLTGAPQAAPEQPLGHLPPHNTLPCPISAGLLFQRKGFSPFSSPLSQFSVIHTFKDALWGSLPRKPPNLAKPGLSKQFIQIPTAATPTSTALPWKGTCSVPPSLPSFTRTFLDL